MSSNIYQDFINFFWIYNCLSFLLFLINLNQNTTLHTFIMSFIPLRIDSNTPVYAMRDTDTRSHIY